MANAARKLSEYLGELLDAPVKLADGSQVIVERKASRTKWRKTALWQVVEDVAGRSLVDTSGQIVTALDRRLVEELCELRTGNRGVWREIADVDLDEFCDVKWTSTAKVVPA
jgi:hypothetical protein